MNLKYPDTKSPIIVWQNTNRQVQMRVLGSDPDENRQYLLSLLTERNEPWIQDTWIWIWPFLRMH